MKQSTRIASPTVGTTVDTMMICVVLICRTDTCLSVVVAEGKADPDAGYALVEIMSCVYTNGGTAGEGGKAAVHPSYPNQALRDEYFSFKKTLYSEVLADAFG